MKYKFRIVIKGSGDFCSTHFHQCNSFIEAMLKAEELCELFSQTTKEQLRVATIEEQA